MKTVSAKKYDHLLKLSNDRQVISALAIDQRTSLERMLDDAGLEGDLAPEIKKFKACVSEILTSGASAILLDPQYGLAASQVRADNAGLLLAYEVSGYDKNEAGRLPRFLPGVSVHRLAEAGADAVKFLLYYDCQEGAAINDQKHAIIERLGAECEALGLPLFLEIVTYDAEIADKKSLAFAKKKPEKVLMAMKEFSKPQYGVDVLKIEVPVDMAYVTGYAQGEVAYSEQEARDYFKAQDQATDLPYIYLSAGVSAELFQDTLRFAHEAGARFNGVLCGRATWRGAVEAYADQGEAGAKKWLEAEGLANLAALNEVLQGTAIPWSEKIKKA